MEESEREQAKNRLNGKAAGRPERDVRSGRLMNPGYRGRSLPRDGWPPGSGTAHRDSMRSFGMAALF